MSSSASTGSAPVSRRQEYRQATIEEIKARARRQLAERGPGAVSLRAIARDMRMASSALYRYFASYDDLISVLCVDAYNGVADALVAARDARPADDPAGRWWAICHAYRRWALDNPADFALIFGTPVPGYQAPAQVTGPAAGRFAAVMFDVLAGAVGAGVVDPGRTQIPAEFRVGELVPQLVSRTAGPGSSRLAGITLTAWASVLGYLVVEVFGSLPQLVVDRDELYDAHVRTVMLGMGFHPDRVEALSRP